MEKSKNKKKIGLKGERNGIDLLKKKRERNGSCSSENEKRCNKKKKLIDSCNEGVPAFNPIIDKKKDYEKEEKEKIKIKGKKKNGGRKKRNNFIQLKEEDDDVREEYNESSDESVKEEKIDTNKEKKEKEKDNNTNIKNKNDMDVEEGENSKIELALKKNNEASLFKIINVNPVNDGKKENDNKDNNGNVKEIKEKMSYLHSPNGKSNYMIFNYRYIMDNLNNK